MFRARSRSGVHILDGVSREFSDDDAAAECVLSSLLCTERLAIVFLPLIMLAMSCITAVSFAQSLSL